MACIISQIQKLTEAKAKDMKKGFSFVDANQ